MLETLGNVGDFLAGIGVIVTLIYLATQIRQNTRVVRAAAHHSNSQGWNDLNAALGSDAEAA